MRLVIQRVLRASLTSGSGYLASIGRGLLVLAGFEEKDGEEDLAYCCEKMCHLRIFQDTAGKMNLSVMDVDAEILLVSQFTLHALTKKGKRPSFIRAARQERALELYKKFISETSKITGKPCKTGEFGAMMQVELINDGPVTILLDSKNRE